MPVHGMSEYRPSVALGGQSPAATVAMLPRGCLSIPPETSHAWWLGWGRFPLIDAPTPERSEWAGLGQWVLPDFVGQGNGSCWWGWRRPVQHVLFFFSPALDTVGRGPTGNFWAVLLPCSTADPDPPPQAVVPGSGGRFCCNLWVSRVGTWQGRHGIPVPGVSEQVWLWGVVLLDVSSHLKPSPWQMGQGLRGVQASIHRVGASSLFIADPAPVGLGRAGPGQWVLSWCAGTEHGGYWWGGGVHYTLLLSSPAPTVVHQGPMATPGRPPNPFYP